MGEHGLQDRHVLPRHGVPCCEHLPNNGSASQYRLDQHRGRIREPFPPPSVVSGDLAHDRGHALADSLVGGPPEQLLGWTSPLHHPAALIDEYEHAVAWHCKHPRVHPGPKLDPAPAPWLPTTG